jgi:hypothetical protein
MNQFDSRRVEIGNWVWECVADPTRDALHPNGDFLHRRFRQLDLNCSAAERTWPEGITFQHVKTGARVHYRAGRLVNA